MIRDAVIVGSGAGGGPLALTLSRAGLDVLVLEKGPRHRREDYRQDEVAVLRERFFVPDPAEDPHTVVTERSPNPHLTELGWIATCVGGGTVHMGGYLYRFHPADFEMRTRFGPHRELADWPYGYDELEPYYGIAERAVGVSGRAGANPFAGRRSTGYPMPPLDPHPFVTPFESACRKRRLHPFPTPRAINSRPRHGRPPCAYCDLCGGYGCPVGARGSTQEALIPRAEATGRCEVIPDAMVKEVTTTLRDGAPRADGCVWIDSQGTEHRVEARLVLVCASAIESARLLLLSRSPRFPDGLGNGEGLVGRNLQFHAVTQGWARFRTDRHPDLPLGPRGPVLGRSVMDHYFLPDGVGEIAKGGLIRFDMLPTSPVLVAELLATAGGGPAAWGEPLVRRLRAHHLEHRGLEFEVFHDFLPDERVKVELDPEIRDRWGLPVARIHLAVPEHHGRAGRWLAERALELLDDLGADESATSQVGGTSSYLVHGTCRAGHDPATSVLDPHCRVHDLPNLYVVDGSFLPTSGGAAPTLTILANSFRTADHLLRRWRAGELG